jgi:prephenate dehydrogenase
LAATRLLFLHLLLMPPLPHRIAILGPGLLGGSMALALRAASNEVHIRLWGRRQAAVVDVQARGLADFASTEVREACEGAELVILCTPVESMPDLAKLVAASTLAEGCVITDVGSVKGSVVAALESIFSPTSANFVGSHPMAGSERAGLEAARAGLFQNATAIITPTLFSSDHALAVLRAFWQTLGCRLVEMSPEEHDRKIARISHLPHLMAAAVTLAALRDEPSAAECVGSGFRDATRIAAGDPDLWTGIVLQNRDEIVDALSRTRHVLSELLAMVEDMDEKNLRRFLGDAKTLRDQVPASA